MAETTNSNSTINKSVSQPALGHQIKIIFICLMIAQICFVVVVVQMPCPVNEFTIYQIHKLNNHKIP